jgi:hypothetical protein
MTQGKKDASITVPVIGFLCRQFWYINLTKQERMVLEEFLGTTLARPHNSQKYN